MNVVHFDQIIQRTCQGIGGYLPITHPYFWLQRGLVRPITANYANQIWADSIGIMGPVLESSLIVASLGQLAWIYPFVISVSVDCGMSLRVSVNMTRMHCYF